MQFASKNTREVVTVAVGHAGCGLGAAAFELLCLEHGVNPDGTVDGNRTSAPAGLGTLFAPTSSGGTVVPRALFVDLEPTAIDKIRNGAFGGLFHPEQLVAGKEDAASIFARGKYTVGREVIPACVERMRSLIEACDAPQGIALHLSVGGGTGAGLGALLLDTFEKEYPKVSKLVHAVYPSPQLATSVVEPYNAVLATDALAQRAQLVSTFDNEAVYSICRRALDVKRPSFENLNRLIVQVFSSMTCGIRFPGPLSIDMHEFETNLVPYPRLHFALCSVAPVLSPEKARRESLTTSDITSAAFDRRAMMTRCDPAHGRYIASCVLYRGDVAPNDAHAAVGALKKKPHVNFVDWSPAGFKCGVSSAAAPVAVVPGGDVVAPARSVCSVSNSTAITEMFERLTSKFDRMISKKAFLHWFVSEGVEEDEMAGVRQSLGEIIADYGEAGQATIHEEEEEEEEAADTEPKRFAAPAEAP